MILIKRQVNRLAEQGWKTDILWSLAGNAEILDNEIADRLANEAAEEAANLPRGT